MPTHRTQVAIVGAGPAGLFLSQLLHRHGIDSTVLETRSRQAIEQTIRAGVLEQGTVDLMHEIGVGARLAAQGLRHDGVILRFGGRDHRIDFRELTGKSATVYAQHEVITDLVAARVAAGGDLRFEVSDVTIAQLDSTRPTVRFCDGDGVGQEIVADFIAGCDGTTSMCRRAVPRGALVSFERVYPFGWLGILCRAPRSSEELVYALHDRGFALVSTRSPEIQRMYLQCGPSDTPEQWPDTRIWEELRTRLATRAGWRPHEGEIFSKVVVGMRSLVTEPMQFGRLFLAGDAVHVVPPTGAKGLNLAVADVRTLSEAMAEFYRSGRSERLDQYSDTALQRIWKTQRFSWWMTSLLHKFPDNDGMAQRLQLAELDYVTSSRAASTQLAENYVGLPLG